MPEVKFGDALGGSDSEGNAKEWSPARSIDSLRQEERAHGRTDTEQGSGARDQAAATYFQSQMRNLADSLKESMGSMITNAKGDRLSTAKLGDQMIAAAVLRQERNYEMPKKMHDDEDERYSQAQHSGMFATAQNPYYQPVSGL